MTDVADPIVRWYERMPLDSSVIKGIVKDEGFLSSRDFLGSGYGEIPTNVNIGSKFVWLMSNGLRGYGTFTRTISRECLTELVYRDETGIVGGNKSDEYAFGTSVNREIYDVGYKLLDKFPWEK